MNIITNIKEIIRKENEMKNNDDATAYGLSSVVCAILSLFIFGILFGPMAAIIGGIGVNKGSSKSDRMLSLIGLIAGIVATIICLIGIVAATRIR